MGAGIFNVFMGLAVIGIVTLGKGKYKLVLLGDHPTFAVAVGGVVAAFGVYQVVRSLMRRKPPIQDD